MKEYSVWMVVSLLLFAGAARGSVEENPTQRRFAVVSAFDLAMRAYHPGITVFGNEGWSAEDTGFDINATVLDAVQLSCSREVKLVNGAGMHLLPEKEAKARSQKENTLELGVKLDKLGQEWQVDEIVLIFDGVLLDSIGQTSLALTGFGVYMRAGREVVFWIPQVAVFDCKLHRFIGSKQSLNTQRLPDLEWQKNWGAFGPSQQHAVRRELDALVKGCMPALLSATGLSDKSVGAAKKSFASMINFPGANARPSVTESNQLEIPPGISTVDTRRAVVGGFKQQEWTITSETEIEVTGVRHDDSAEAHCTVTFKDRMVTFSHEGYQIRADGTHAPKEFARWQKNLREAILGNLMGGIEGLKPPEGNQIEVPPGMAMAAARLAVLAGFRARDWSITTDDPEQIIGVYRKGKKEALCTVTLKDRLILLAPDGYENLSDGKRLRVEYRRWQNNLKESIFGELMRVRADSEP